LTARVQALFWLGLLLCFFLALYLLSAILLPFVAGFAIAFFLDPVVDWFETWRVPRALATFIVLVAFLLAVVLVILLLVPLLQGQVSELVRRAPGLAASAQHQIDRAMQLLQEQLAPEDFLKLRDAIATKLGDAVGVVARLLQSVLTSSLAIVNILSLVFITPVVAFFLLRDWDRMVAQVDEWVPRRQVTTVREQAGLVNETLAGFMRGQAAVCMAMGLYYAVALSLAGLDFGLVIGFIVGLLTFIPFVGATTGAVLSLGLAMAQFSSWTPVAIVAGIFLVGQTLESNVLTPKLVGERVHLHPVWIMFALLAFGALFGFLGVLLAVPVAAILGVLVRFALARYLASPLYDPDGPARS
jgi:predicted PurR-regulated permease PerM